jgi:hypothetical protein
VVPGPDERPTSAPWWTRHRVHITGGPVGPGSDASHDVELAAEHAHEGRVPAPSGASATTSRASPAVRIGYGPPPGTLPAVTRVRSTATAGHPLFANRELTERPTAHRSADTARRARRACPDPFGRRSSAPAHPGLEDAETPTAGTPEGRRVAPKPCEMPCAMLEHDAFRRKRIRAHPGDSRSQYVANRTCFSVRSYRTAHPKEGVTKRRALDSHDSSRGFVSTHRSPLTFFAVSEGSPVITADSERDRPRSTPNTNRR